MFPDFKLGVLKVKVPFCRLPEYFFPLKLTVIFPVASSFNVILTVDNFPDSISEIFIVEFNLLTFIFSLCSDDL